MAEVLLCVTLPTFPAGRLPIRLRPGAANHLRIVPDSPWPADVRLPVTQHHQLKRACQQARRCSLCLSACLACLLRLGLAEPVLSVRSIVVSEVSHNLSIESYALAVHCLLTSLPNCLLWIAQKQTCL